LSSAPLSALFRSSRSALLSTKSEAHKGTRVQERAAELGSLIALPERKAGSLSQVTPPGTAAERVVLAFPERHATAAMKIKN
jgi:hypothetical protein